MSFTNFCDGCGNIMHVHMDAEELRLFAECQRCPTGREDRIVLAERRSLCMSTTSRNVVAADTTLRTASKILMNDPTIPRISSVPCPNADCSTGEEPECMYITTNGNNTYICCRCSTCFTTTAKNAPK